MLTFPTRFLTRLVALAVLASAFVLPLGAPSPAAAGELKKIDNELNKFLASKKKPKKKHHHKKKKHHHKKKKKTVSLRQLEQQLDNVLDRDLGKKG